MGNLRGGRWCIWICICHTGRYFYHLYDGLLQRGSLISTAIYNISYTDISQVIGDAFAAVCFIRNAFATIIAITLTNWINGVGLDAVFATSAALSFVFAATTVPMLIWGKRMRILVWRRGWFDKMSERQFGHRE